MAFQELGTVTAINRYPVKSMHAEPLASAELRWTGLLGDRQYAFVRSANRSRFPWLTGRDISGMVLYRPRFADPANPAAEPPRVTTPDGADHAVTDPALLDRLAAEAGEAVHLMHLGKGCQDAMPVSVVATETLRRLEEARSGPIGLDRFRINLVIEASPGAGRETDWLGGTMRFGDPEDGPTLVLGSGVARCAMVTIDPVTAERDPSVLRMVAQDFDNEIGAYGTATRLGVISVGDRVWLGRV